MEDVKEIGEMSTQPETSRKLKISPTLLLVLISWNLDRPCPCNLIPSLRKHSPAQRSPKPSSPLKKGKMWSLSSISTKQLSNARLQLKFHSMHASSETPVNFFSQFIPTPKMKGNFSRRYIRIGYSIRIFFWWKHYI
jgi:hypothetical protein